MITNQGTTITIELRELADKFSEGWHDGIKIDACDVMLLTNAADEIERLRATLAAPATAKARKPRLNSAAFMAALISAAELRKVSMRDVSLATGVSETTLSRMRRGERACDAASFSALSAWAGLNPQDFYFPSTKPATAPDRKPVARVAEVHMSRYTLEWIDGPLSEGTLLYKDAP